MKMVGHESPGKAFGTGFGKKFGKALEWTCRSALYGFMVNMNNI
jgi:hypothetical protein